MNRKFWAPLFVVVLFGVAHQPAYAQFTYPTLLYDFSTGNVKFFVRSPVFAFRVFSEEHLLIPEVGNDLGFQLTTRSTVLFSWLSFAPVAAGVLDAGNIVQPVEYSRRFHMTADVHFTLSGLVTPMHIVYVPEPPTLVLVAASFAMLGAICLSRGRRRDADDSMKVPTIATNLRKRYPEVDS